MTARPRWRGSLTLLGACVLAAHTAGGDEPRGGAGRPGGPWWEAFPLVYTDWNGGPRLVLGGHPRLRPVPFLALDGGLPAAGQAAPAPADQRVAFVTWDQSASSWTLAVARFDAPPLLLAHLAGGPGAGQPAWSPDGAVIAYIQFSGRPSQWELRRVSAGGGPSQRLASLYVPPGYRLGCIQPRWAPDGSEVLAAAWRPGSDEGILLAANARSGAVRVVHDPEGTGTVCAAAWSPSGHEAAFVAWSDERQAWVLTRAARDGSSHTDVLVLDGGFGVGQVQWSPDGSELAFVDFDYALSNAVLRKVRVEGGSPYTLDDLDAGVGAGAPQWSPEGDRIAYVRFNQAAGQAAIAILPSAGGRPEEVAWLGTGIAAGHPQWRRAARR